MYQLAWFLEQNKIYYNLAQPCWRLLYGSSTQLVLSVWSGVNVFTLDPSLGEFILVGITSFPIRVDQEFP